MCKFICKMIIYYQLAIGAEGFETLFGILYCHFLLKHLSGLNYLASFDHMNYHTGVLHSFYQQYLLVRR